uniref:Uncharacterized protein n=1 Tax=Arundo donax TaxID=35708 RepID=A0A0A8YKK5_ARUDO
MYSGLRSGAPSDCTLLPASVALIDGTVCYYSIPRYSTPLASGTLVLATTVPATTASGARSMYSSIAVEIT